MSDLLEFLPDFDLKPYTHLLHSLEKNNITVAQLISLDHVTIAKQCPLPSADVQKLVKDVVQALQRDALQVVRKKHKITVEEPEEDEPSSKKAKPLPPKDVPKITTLDPRIDQALNAGIQPAQVLEIVGESGVGKTQLVLQLLLSAQLPPPRGLGKAAIYVSTEGPLNTKRLMQLLIHNEEYDELSPEERPSLDRVHTITVSDLEAQEHILNYQLPVGIQRYNVGLVVLDSVAANFRAEHETRTPAQLADRAVELTKLGKMLKRIAIEHGVAVVVTNQVSDRFDNSSYQLRPSSPAMTSSPGGLVPNVPPALAERRQEIQSLDHQQRFFTGWGDEKWKTKQEQLKTPALGLAWANQISARIVLKMDSERQEYAGGSIWKDKKRVRTFSVVFAPWAAPTNPPIRYEIAMQGIVSVPEPEKPKKALEPVDEVQADLLNEALWATDDDDEFP